MTWQEVDGEERCAIAERLLSALATKQAEIEETRFSVYVISADEQMMVEIDKEMKAFPKIYKSL